MTEPIVIGVDGGGSKTDVVVATATGTVIGRARAGRTNWEVVGLDAMAATLHDVVRAAQSDAGTLGSPVASAVFCLAGVDWPSDIERIRPRLDSLVLGGTLHIANDAQAALAAGTPDGIGIVSIAGTGGSTAGRNASGAAFRTIAGSIGEGSGASGIVRDLVEAVARGHHGQSEPSVLSARLLAALDLDSVPELFERLMRGPRPRIDARLAPLVFAAAPEGDATARAIVERNARQHAVDVGGVARLLGMHRERALVVSAGGVHRAGNHIWDATFAEDVQRLIPGARCVPLTVAPVYGAARLALTSIDAPRAAAAALADAARAER